MKENWDYRLKIGELKPTILHAVRSGEFGGLTHDMLLVLSGFPSKYIPVSSGLLKWVRVSSHAFILFDVRSSHFKYIKRVQSSSSEFKHVQVSSINWVCVTLRELKFKCRKWSRVSLSYFKWAFSSGDVSGFQVRSIGSSGWVSCWWRSSHASVYVFAWWFLSGVVRMALES